MPTKPMPFDFLLSYLPRNTIVQPAIGMFYIYWNKKIVLIARQTEKNPQHNGLWIATDRPYHASLKQDVPALSDFIFEDGADVASNWLLLSDAHDDFESAAITIAELISKRDLRIGRITPRSKLL